jgi:drug/metabolite transporter (DMT)-like permease
MELYVFAIVILGAALHASWNALIKISGDRFTVICWLALFQTGVAIAALPFVPMPSGQIWFWVIASGALHSAYKIFLSQAYQHGDLTQVYPLARGTAPLLTTLIAVVVLSETITLWSLAGVVTIAFGIMSMAIKGGQPGGSIATKTVVLALITSVLISSYTTVDGYGARLAGSPHTFIVYMHVFDGLIMGTALLLFRKRTAVSLLKLEWRRCAVGGFFSVASYWIAIWAMTKAPIASVAALRETSVLFAVVIGVVFMGEKLTFWRAFAVVLILVGVVLLRIN